MKRAWIGLAILGVVVMILTAGIVWWLFQPAAAVGQPTQQFVIAPKENSSDVAAKLTQAGLIKSPLVFKIVTKQLEVDSKLKAGSFDISPSMTPFQIARVLSDTPSGIWVTIPEGKRREEIAAMLANTKLEKFDEQQFIEATQDKEGYLFPDTYLFPREASTSAVINLLTKTFTIKVTNGLATEFAASKHTPQEIITLASIVQREAKTYQDMQTVAGIFWNRIAIDMPLQSDVTAEYFHGYDAKNQSWWGTSTPADRQSDSPYNTYIAKGLPPTPISNPGLDAIKAVLNPLPSSDLFFLADPQGRLHTAKTLDEHNANIEKYLR